MYYLNRSNLVKDGYYLKVIIMKNNVSDSFLVKAPSENYKNVIKEMISELRRIKKSEELGLDEVLNTLCDTKYFKTVWEFDSNNEPCKLLGYMIYCYKDGIGYKLNKI